MGVKVGVTKEARRKNRHFKTYATIILFFIMLVVGTIFLAKPFSYFLGQTGVYGYLSIFLVGLANNATVILPTPFLGATLPFLVEFADQQNSVFLVAAVYAIGATFGEMVSYFLGWTGRKIVNWEDNERYQGFSDWFARRRLVMMVAKWRWVRWLRKHTGFTITFLSFQLIIPFDIAGIVAGSIRYSPVKFILFCFLGRLPKYLIIIAFGLEVWNLFSL